MIKWAVSACLLLVGLVAGSFGATVDSRADAGETVYLQGLTGKGTPIEATRSADTTVRGRAAACVNCHQRSGLGGHEGRSVIPPITSRYLFRPRVSDKEERDLPFVAGMHADNREPYDDATLARAIKEGLDSEGKPLSYLMPRYALGDEDMAALVAHLKKLDRRKVPGVTASTLHFATIITPDADPAKRRAMLDVMNQFFTDRNVRQMAPAPHLLASGKTAYTGMMFKVQRRWELHVWELTGPESSWQQQLEQRLASEPVFAVVAGLGGKTWAPVQAFCERAALPCLFPNIDAPPPDADRDFYSIYFSRGVLLEAELMAKAVLADGAGAAPGRVLQVYRAGDSGEAGAAALSANLKSHGVTVTDRVLPRDAPAAATTDMLRAEVGADALALWLRPNDVAALPDTPPSGSTVYLSGLMAGLERTPLPPAWRAGVHMAYPFDLPDRRRVRVDYALGWLHGRKVPMVAEQLQVDTYLALGLLSETLKSMADTFVRDYLVERLEETLAHRIVTGYYPHLGMSTGQRYASKGGYLVHLAAPQGTAVIADGDWTVP